MNFKCSTHPSLKHLLFTTVLTLISHLFVPVVNQYYEAQVYDIFVIKGNAAVFKCNVPSFVSDHLEIISWEDTLGGKYLPPSKSDFGMSFCHLCCVIVDSAEHLKWFPS